MHSLPSCPDLSGRARQLATEAAAGAGPGIPDRAAKTDELAQELEKRMAYHVSLGLDPMADTLEELMPGFQFIAWNPLSLAVRRRAQKLVSDHVLFPEGTCSSPDIVTQLRAEALEAELVKRMTYLASLGIDPLTQTWEELLPA